MLKSHEYDLDMAVSAPQLGLIQMDHGLITSEPHNVQHLVDHSLLRPFLSLGEIVAIMDHLIMYETMWLSGAPLHQTLLTNVYIQNPELAPLPLRCFCISVLHFIEIVRDLAFSGQISTVCLSP